MERKPHKQSEKSYRKTLQILQERVDAGVPLKFVDSCELGNKYTCCTLGLCDEGVESEMDGESRERHHFCPHDGRYFTAEGEATNAPIDPFNGCFWKCLIFRCSKESRDLAGERIRKVAGAV